MLPPVAMFAVLLSIPNTVAAPYTDTKRRELLRAKAIVVPPTSRTDQKLLTSGLKLSETAQETGKTEGQQRRNQLEAVDRLEQNQTEQADHWKVY